MKIQTDYGRLPDAELEIMQVLWEHETMLSRPEIETYLREKELDWDTSTVNSLLSRLKTRGFLRAEKEGKKYFYKTLVSEEAYLQTESKKFLTKLFGGKTVNFIVALAEGNQISEEEFEELEEFLNQRKENL